MKTILFSRQIVIQFLVLCLSIGVAQNSKVENAKPALPFDPDERLTGNPLAFFVIGDWGTGNRAQRRAVNAMSEKMKSDGAIAVLTTGDNFLGAGVSSTNDNQWESKFESVFPSELNVPFYATLGNHDYTLNPNAQVEYTGKMLPSGTATRWMMPARYWTTTFNIPTSEWSIRIIGLDTPGMISANIKARQEQLDWLDSILTDSNELWKIVVGHHPVYSNGMHGNTIGMIKHVKPILEKHKVDIYLAGHDHDLQMLTPENGVHYIVNGGFSQSTDVRWEENTIFAMTNCGFMWMQINAQQILVQFLDNNGKISFAYKIKAER